MTHAVRIVCRPAVRDGFALAGVTSLPAVDGVEAAAALAELVEEPQTGVVFVEESLYRMLSEAFRDALDRRPLPVVVPFPGPRGEGESVSAERELVELLRSSIGYRVRLR